MTFNEAARAVSQGVRKVEDTDHFYEIRNQSNKVGFDVRAVLKRWLGESPEPNQLIIAAMLFSRLGSGDDVEWWEGLQPDRNGDHSEAWSSTLYLLRHRRWQKHEQER